MGDEVMKAVLVALNSRYAHTNLALRLLLRATEREWTEGEERIELELWEATINEDWRRIAAALYRKRADVYAFSVYIWNLDQVRLIAARLKQLHPAAVIVFGGPEVSYDAQECLQEYAWLDYLLIGEAEQSFPRWLRALQAGDEEAISTVPGLACRQRPADSAPAFVQLDDLALLPFPYSDRELSEDAQRIFYYESSRGCPFDCQYCLSAAQRPVRFRPLAVVYDDLQRFVEAGVRQVKFVDRTFNCRPEHCLGIWRYLIDHCDEECPTSFHFELEAALISEEMLQLLSEAPPGLFQFEIGIQSSHPPTLAAVHRPDQLEIIAQRVRQLQALRKQHIHLDLIAGLPHEGWPQLQESFDWVARLQPEMLQLGFLKLLKGSGLRRTASGRGDIYSDQAPYEILQTACLDHDELLRLQDMADLVERYRNSGRYRFLFQGLERMVASPFQLVQRMAEYWQRRGFGLTSKEHLHYQRLAEFAAAVGMAEDELSCRLALDFCLWHRSDELPERLRKAVAHDAELLRRLRQQWSEAEIIAFFPFLAGLDGKRLWQQMRMEPFVFDPDRLLEGELKTAPSGAVQLFALRRDRFGQHHPHRQMVLVRES